MAKMGELGNSRLKRIWLVCWNWLKKVWNTGRSCADGSVPVSRELRQVIVARLIIVLLVLLPLFFALGYRLWILQIRDHEEYAKKANKLFAFRQTFWGVRGEIFDRRGELLAGNYNTNEVVVIPRHIVDRNQAELLPFCRFLSSYVGCSTEELYAKFIKSLHRDVVMTVKEDASAELLRAVASEKIAGVSVQLPDAAGKGGKIVYRIPDAVTVQSQLSAILRIEQLLGISQGDLLEQVYQRKHSQTPVVVQKYMPVERADQLKKEFAVWNRKPGRRKANKIPGNTLQFHSSVKRIYPMGRALFNLLGFCDGEGIARSGIEKLMDEELRERRETRIVQTDGALSWDRFPAVVRSTEHDGSAVHLTIDWQIQEKVETYLKELTDSCHPKFAYAVMADPRTGAILALAQYPSHDPNAPLSSPDEPDSWNFHAIGSIYEPGSIMKGISVASVLDATHLPVTFPVDCRPGRFYYGSRKPIGEYRGHDYGQLDIAGVIQKSSNVGSAKLVVEHLEMPQFNHYLESFGFGKPTGLGFYPGDGSEPKIFSGESKGMMIPLQKWVKSDFARMPIGHAIAVTPFQMVQAYCALANGGIMMQLRIVDRVVTPDQKIQVSLPMIKGQPISREAALKITQCLKAVTQKGGTATEAAVKGYAVAGKTGTATKYTDARKNTASFVGFLPADRPAVVLLISVDEPKGARQTGGVVCGKCFSQIAADTMKILQIPPDP